MPISITSDGLDFPVIPPEAGLQEWVDRHVDLSSVITFDEPFTGKNRDLWSKDVLSRFPPLKLGTVFYPPGASNFAVAYLVVPTSLVEDLYGVGAVQLNMYNDLSLLAGVTLTMEAIGSYPLTNNLLTVQGGDALSLLVMVDARYALWGSSIGDATILQVPPTTVTQWSDLIPTYLPGYSITVDTISDNYGVPSEAINGLQEPVGPWLDMIALNVGMRVIIQDYTNPESLSLILASTAIPLYAGNISNTNYTVGGDVSGADLEIQLTMPSAINVAFPDATLNLDNPHSPGNNDPNQPADFVSVATGLVTHTETNDASSVFPTATPTGRDLLIRDTANFVADGNDFLIQQLAQQISNDLYAWFTIRANFDLPGIQAWGQDGFHTVTWTYTADKVQTSIRPVPLHQSRPDEMHHETIASDGSISYGSSAKIHHGQHVFYNLATTGEVFNTGICHNWGIMECANPYTPTDQPIGHLIPRVSVGPPTAPAPAGSMQWDDLNGCFWIYDLANTEWVQIGGLCGNNNPNIIYGQTTAELGGGLYTWNQIVPYPGHPCMWIQQGLTGQTACEINATTGIVNGTNMILFKDQTTNLYFFSDQVSGVSGTFHVCLDDGSTHTFVFQFGLLKSVT